MNLTTYLIPECISSFRSLLAAPLVSEAPLFFCLNQVLNLPVIKSMKSIQEDNYLSPSLGKEKFKIDYSLMIL